MNIESYSSKLLSKRAKAAEDSKQRPYPTAMKYFLLYYDWIFPIKGVLTNTDMSNILKVCFKFYHYDKINPVLLEVMVS